MTNNVYVEKITQPPIRPFNCVKFNSNMSVKFMKEQAFNKDDEWFHVRFHDQWISCYCFFWGERITPAYEWRHDGQLVNETAIVETIRKWKKYV